MRSHEIAVEVHRVANLIQRVRGIPHRAAMAIAQRAARRAGRATATVAVGLGVEADARVPKILTDINAAGQDARVVAARQAVSSWSWLIPVGGLLMSLKNKISGGGASKAAFSSVEKSMGRRR